MEDVPIKRERWKGVGSTGPQDGGAEGDPDERQGRTGGGSVVRQPQRGPCVADHVPDVTGLLGVLWFVGA